LREYKREWQRKHRARLRGEPGFARVLEAAIALANAEEDRDYQRAYYRLWSAVKSWYEKDERKEAA
jgi:hypothetical protein